MDSVEFVLNAEVDSDGSSEWKSGSDLQNFLKLPGIKNCICARDLLLLFRKSKLNSK